MGLYLCVFEDDNELDGVEVGAYSDYGHFVDYVAERLEMGLRGSVYPTLTMHSDCDGVWDSVQAAKLCDELESVRNALAQLPPVPYGSAWKESIAKLLGLKPANAYESFFDVDGELLIDRVIGLAKLAAERELPILFQ